LFRVSVDAVGKIQYQNSKIFELATSTTACPIPTPEYLVWSVLGPIMLA
jgi:hypothetical protein